MPVIRVEPQVTESNSVVAPWDGELAAVSTIDGAIIWSRTLPFGTPFVDSIGANGNVIVVAMNSVPRSD